MVDSRWLIAWMLSKLAEDYLNLLFNHIFSGLKLKLWYGLWSIVYGLLP
jgi:hypothetical protein